MPRARRGMAMVRTRMAENMAVPIPPGIGMARVRQFGSKSGRPIGRPRKGKVEMSAPFSFAKVVKTGGKQRNLFPGVSLGMRG